ncbi:unnamed protein product [Fusarium graminearum]|nr:unnamed protein product [Fusarium graminearum]
MSLGDRTESGEILRVRSSGNSPPRVSIFEEQELRSGSLVGSPADSGRGRDRGLDDGLDGIWGGVRDGGSCDPDFSFSISGSPSKETLEGGLGGERQWFGLGIISSGSDSGSGSEEAMLGCGSGSEEILEGILGGERY